MESVNHRYNELIAHARSEFIIELKSRIREIDKLLIEHQDFLPLESVPEILRFFHSISGTASTLGFDRLAGIGRKNETIIKTITGSANNLGAGTIRGIIDALETLKLELNLVDPDFPGPVADGREYTSLADLGTILLIDDDLIVLKLLEHAFAMEGYTVHVCDQPLLALDFIAASKPDVILLDIVMPNCNGYEILYKIKSNPEYADICVVFLSGMDDTEDKIRGMKAGIDDYITKPFDVREVVLRVEMILRRANKFREKLLKDSLTGAYSRYYFNERIRDDFERFKRNQTVFSIAMIDLDFFKRINDSYGHRAGDFVLTAFVAFANEKLRESDCVCRYGGEEFVFLLPDTDEEQAFLAVDRVRKEFCRRPISFGEETFYISFSAGIKQISAQMTTVSQLIGMADEALYFAKSEGRNRVVGYSQMSGENRRQKTLLLVDDENTVLKLLSERLSEAGYKIVTACDGQEALSLAAEVYPDGIILDRILPGMDGLEICRQLKENVLTHLIKIIILSQKKKEEDIIAGLQCGADDYVVKPFSLGELEARIFRVLNRCQ